MSFQSIIIFVVSVSVLSTANIANEVLEVHMLFKLILIKEMSFAKTAKRMHKNYVTKVIDVTSFKMLV